MNGFVDLQVNGFLGVDFSAPGLQLEQVKFVVEGLKERGTIAFCPTVITSCEETYKRNLPVLAEAMSRPDLSPHLLGIHLEGPFISPLEGARGAHPEQFVREPDWEFFKWCQTLARGEIALVTLSPGEAGGLELIQRIRESGVAVSLGHHLANHSQIEQAFRRGAQACTHLGNGLPTLIHRHENPLWAQLAQRELQVMLIADGHHLPRPFLEVVVRLRTAEELIVVSDSAPIGGLPPGLYNTLGQDVVLEESGKLWNPVKQCLVGSSRCLMECMNYLAGLDLLSEKELWKVGLNNPLKLINQELDFGAMRQLPEVEFLEGQFQITPP